jgi:hypothetical protein
MMQTSIVELLVLWYAIAVVPPCLLRQWYCTFQFNLLVRLCDTSFRNIPDYRKSSESAASTKSSPFTNKPAQANESGCGSSYAQIAAPGVVRGLEDKAIEDLKDMHVEAVDEEDKPFAWKTLSQVCIHSMVVCDTRFCQVLFTCNSGSMTVTVRRRNWRAERIFTER